MTYYEIHSKLDRLCRHEQERTILKGVFENLEKDGYNPDEERVRIIETSLNFLSFQYCMTEELSSETKIDCSTLISQSFWEGAQIGVPFTADRQRSAPDAISVNYSNLLPGDVAIKFPNVESSYD